MPKPLRTMLAKSWTSSRLQLYIQERDLVRNRNSKERAVRNRTDLQSNLQVEKKINWLLQDLQRMVAPPNYLRDGISENLSYRHN